MTPAKRHRDERLRVLHLDHSSEAGGAELALRRMLAAGPDWIPLVLTPPPGDADAFAGLRARRTAGVRQSAGVSGGRVGTLAAAGAALAVQTAATRLHPAFRTADIVDANTTRAALYAALAVRTRRVPFVVHLRDTVDPDTLGEVGCAAMGRLVLPVADGVIANSRATLATASPYLRAGTVTEVIPSASGLWRGRPAAAHESLRVEGLRIGMLARIDPWKGQELLLDAVAQVVAERPGRDIRLQFAGGAPFGHEDFVGRLRSRAVERGLGGRVDFLGHVDDVPSLLAGWDIAVQYSTRPEPLGQNVLQYLAAGKTVVVADEGGPVDWVVDDVNGVRVAPRDAGVLARALGALVDDPPRRARLAAAAAQTPGLLDDAAVARAHAEFYRRVARTREVRAARGRG